MTQNNQDLTYHCEKCEPRHIDQERARAYQEELLKRSMQHDKTSTDTASTDEDDTGELYSRNGLIVNLSFLVQFVIFISYNSYS